MKKIILLVILFIVGFGIGALVKSNIPKSMSAESRISNYNWISCYDLYDYEEAVLKDGDTNIMTDIISEASVDRFPYILIVYEVHKKDVRKDMIQVYNLYCEDSMKRYPRAFVPLNNYLKKCEAFSVVK